MMSSVADRRRRLGEVACDYMRSDLGWSDTQIDKAMAGTGGVDVPWVEFAHTPQLPHLGVVRMFLSAARTAREDGAVFLYCVNDHLPPSSLPESRYLPIKNVQGQVAKPPRFGPGKRSGDKGMDCLEPPSPDTLGKFCDRWLALMQPERPTILELMEVVSKAESSVTSFAGWLTRVTLELLDLTPLVLPSSRIAEAFPEDVERLKASPEIYGWSHCAACGKRVARWSGADDSRCGSCSGSEVVFRPDVRGRQAVTNLAGLSKRICGRKKQYQGEADSLTRTLFHCEPPARSHIEGATRFALDSGLSVDRANLLQALATSSVGAARGIAPPRDGYADWNLTQSELTNQLSNL